MLLAQIVLPIMIVPSGSIVMLTNALPLLHQDKPAQVLMDYQINVDILDTALAKNVLSSTHYLQEQSLLLEKHTNRFAHQDTLDQKMELNLLQLLAKMDQRILNQHQLEYKALLIVHILFTQQLLELTQSQRLEFNLFVDITKMLSGTVHGN